MAQTKRAASSTAKKLRALLRENPEATVSDLAVRIDGATEVQVIEALDEYRVEEGKLVHVGPGRGGGWVS